MVANLQPPPVEDLRVERKVVANLQPPPVEDLRVGMEGEESGY